MLVDSLALVNHYMLSSIVYSFLANIFNVLGLIIFLVINNQDFLCLSLKGDSYGRLIATKNFRA